MKVPSRRLIALSGSALMIMGMTVTGAGAASAADNITAITGNGDQIAAAP